MKQASTIYCLFGTYFIDLRAVTMMSFTPMTTDYAAMINIVIGASDRSFVVPEKDNGLEIYKSFNMAWVAVKADEHRQPIRLPLTQKKAKAK